MGSFFFPHFHFKKRKIPWPAVARSEIKNEKKKDEGKKSNYLQNDKISVLTGKGEKINDDAITIFEQVKTK